MGCQSGEIASDGTWEKFATMRSRKGKSGQRGEDTSAGKQDEAASPSAPAGLTLLWACLLLLVAGSGVGGWYLQQQLRTIGSLEQSVQILHRKLSQLETIHSQVAELNEKLMITETHEQKLQDLKIAWTDAERKMDKATEAVAQIQSADLESKVSRLQSEMSKGLNELRKDLLTKKDLEHLEHMVKVLREVDFAHANQEVTTVKIATLKLKENVDSLSVSLSTLTSRVAGLEAKSKDLETLQQSVEDISTVKELMDHSLPQLSNGVIALTKQVNQTAQVIDVIQSQLVQDSKELSALKDYTLGQQVEHLSIKEELKNIRKMAYNLQMEKIPMEVVENAIRSSVAGDIRELQNHTSKMDEILVNLQNDIIKVEWNGDSKNKQLVDALNETSHTLQKSLGKIETNLKRTIKQCLSGEVRTYCETSENCSWPHIREVDFPHRILKDPVIMLSLVEISSVDSLGVTVKTINVTDSGFKIQINNIGNNNLSTVRVNWMLCA